MVNFLTRFLLFQDRRSLDWLGTDISDEHHSL